MSDVAKIEASLDVELPESYAKTLLAVDAALGQSPYPFGSENFVTGADEIIRLNEQVWASSAADWGNIAEPTDYFFIGHDGCGNYFSIDLDNEDSPVYYFVHDPLELIEQAASIEEFVSLLTGPKPPTPFD